MNPRNVCIVAFFLLAGSLILAAQSPAGVIIGRVLDPTGAVIAGAKVTATNPQTHQTWTVPTNATGDFVFPSLQPATYDLRVIATGFNQFEQNGLRLTAFARLNAGNLQMRVGVQQSAVTVSAEATPVQTASSERSSTLDPQEIMSLPELGRDPMELLQVTPGVVGDPDGGGGQLGTESTPAINGGRTDYNNVMIDGSSGTLRGGNHLDTPVNLDDIQEVKVESANYEAEYGETAGAHVQIVTKSGTSSYHGSGYYYARNEALNANTWDNNRHTQNNAWDPLPRQRYRYNTMGFTLGGPIYWPGHFDTHKDKLFFFYAQEFDPNVHPNGNGNYTVPTAQERLGDFTDATQEGICGKDVNGNKTGGTSGVPCIAMPLKLVDPTTGKSFSTPNTLPSGRIDPNMQKLMALFPLPNSSDPVSDRYNYVISDSENTPVNEESLRIDYAPANHWHFFARAVRNVSSNSGSKATTDKFRLGPPMDYKVTAPNGVLNATWIVSPTTVNEASFSRNHWNENVLVHGGGLALLQKAHYGSALPQIYPANNPLGLVPALTFDTKSGFFEDAPNVGYDNRFPLQDVETYYSVSDDLSKVWGTHLSKFGVWYENGSSLQMHNQSPGPAEGGFTFNPGDTTASTGNPFADMMLGSFSTYQEVQFNRGTTVLNYHPITRVLEWYAQDNWKIQPRLTLDYGVRFTYGIPQTLTQGANFLPNLFSPAQASQLYAPCLAGKKRWAAPQSEVTSGKCNSGASLVSTTFIGDLVNGGNLGNGMVLAGTPGYPQGLVYGPGLMAAPRLGFAWDVFGDGRTALRGGYGVFYNARNGIGYEGDMTFNPPLIAQATQIDSTTANFLTNPGFVSSPNISHPIELHPKETAVYNATLGLQYELGNTTLLDVAYVGTFGRHLPTVTDINAVHEVTDANGNLALTRFGNIDTSQSQSKGQKFLPDGLIRSNYPGIGSIDMRFFDSNSSYSALQAQMIRRFTRNLSLNVAYTWGSAMDYADDPKGTNHQNGSLPTYLPATIDYGKASYDVAQHLVLSWDWLLPTLGQNWLMKTALGGWESSAIVSFQTGEPVGIGVSAQCDPAPTDPKTGKVFQNPNCPNGSGVEITGSGGNVFANWAGSSKIYVPGLRVNPNAFSGPIVGTIGDANRNIVRGPGFQTWNLAVFKHFSLGERTTFTFRAEAYNAFNHVNYNSFDNTATFYYLNNAIGSAPEPGQFNPTFGQFDGASNPRILQLALRLSF